MFMYMIRMNGRRRCVVWCGAMHGPAGGRLKEQQRHKPIHRAIIKTDSLHNSLKIMANWFLSVGEEHIVRLLSYWYSICGIDFYSIESIS